MRRWILNHCATREALPFNSDVTTVLFSAGWECMSLIDTHHIVFLPRPLALLSVICTIKTIGVFSKYKIMLLNMHFKLYDTVLCCSSANAPSIDQRSQTMSQRCVCVSLSSTPQMCCRVRMQLEFPSSLGKWRILSHGVPCGASCLELNSPAVWQHGWAPHLARSLYSCYLLGSQVP